jgi:hypothetical protein
MLASDRKWLARRTASNKIYACAEARVVEASDILSEDFPILKVLNFGRLVREQGRF